MNKEENSDLKTQVDRQYPGATKQELEDLYFMRSFKGKEKEHESKQGIRIVIAGPPHSGKTVFEKALRHHLPQQDTMRVAAQPDGEGDWTQNTYTSNPELAKQLRKKGKFTEKFVTWAENAVANSSNRFNLIDVGGVISEENRRICAGADAMIIISSDPEKGQDWVGFAKDLNLRVLSLLHSTLDKEKTDELHKTPTKDWETEGTIVGLERGVFETSPSVGKLAAYLDEIIPKVEKKDDKGVGIVSIDNVAKRIGKVAEEISLPGREPFTSINWSPDDLPAVYQTLQKEAQKGGIYKIDGRAPQYLAVSMTHALHPAQTALADTKVKGGMVTISGHNNLKKEGSGPLPFHVTEDFGGGTLVEYARDKFIIIDHRKLNDIIPPETPQAKAVLLSGKTSNWATAEIAMIYAHRRPAVYLFQPGTGFICVITHSPEHRLGSVIDVKPLKPVETETTQEKTT